MKVTQEMLDAYAAAFDTASGKTTDRRRRALQAVLDLGLGESAKLQIDTLTAEVGRLNEENRRLKRALDFEHSDRELDYEYPDSAKAEGRT